MMYVKYQHLTDNFCIKYYLCKSINRKYKKYIQNLELHLMIWLLKRVDTMLLLKIIDIVIIIEDEFHSILEYPYLCELRSNYI
jgi:hypothetical protein